MKEYMQMFPYESFRPNQERMLDTVYHTCKDKKILLIDAPTGSGKSSVIVPTISYAKTHHKKVLIAVRTISQLKIFIKELNLMRIKNPDLTFSYLVGKNTMCPKCDEGNVYALCDMMKKHTIRSMSLKTLDGSPSTDENVCEYYKNSKDIVVSDGKLVAYPSNELLEKSNYFLANTMYYEDMRKHAGLNICPYEMTIEAARKTDVIIVNYYHIFNEGIRESLYYNIGLDPADTILILDEAHNLGNVAQEVQSVTITHKILENAYSEAEFASKTVDVKSVISIIDYTKKFMSNYNSGYDREDCFYIKNFLSGCPNLKLCINTIEEAVEVLKNNVIKGFEYKEGALEKYNDFLNLLSVSMYDNSFIGVYTKNTYGVSLEIRNIDPSGLLNETMNMHHSAILISGTLSPVDMYKKYYFGTNDKINTIVLPNSFPKENRKIFVTSDATSIYSKRNDTTNISAYSMHMKLFCEIPGNIAIYFPSYAVQQQYVDIVRSFKLSKQIFVEPKSSRDASEMLNIYMNLPKTGKSGILLAICGGKWSEGLDYYGDMMNASMVVGLPLSQYSNVQKVINEHFKMKFGNDGEYIAYTLPAINRASQALGRVIRNETDRGVLVLADVRYTYKNINRALPGWMIDEMVNVTSLNFKNHDLIKLYSK